jgi:hypothetical protein
MDHEKFKRRTLRNLLFRKTRPTSPLASAVFGLESAGNGRVYCHCSGGAAFRKWMDFFHFVFKFKYITSIYDRDSAPPVPP